VVTHSESFVRARPEVARLHALAEVAAAAHEGGLEGVLMAITEGVQSAFGYDGVLNLYDPDTDRYVVRAGVGEGTDELMNTSTKRPDFEALLEPRFEVAPDVYFIPHTHEPDLSKLGAVYQREAAWKGPGYWHTNDMCFVRMRTSQGKALGILSVDATADMPIPTLEQFDVLRLFAMVGANAAENVMLMREVQDLGIEREMQSLRQELQDEVALRRSLLEVGIALGAASSGPSEGIFELLAQRLAAVVPIKSLTIYVTDAVTPVLTPLFHSEDDAPDREAIMSFAIAFGEGATGTAAAERRSVLSNVGQAGRPRVEVPDSTPVDEHLLAVPVLVEERVKAVLTLARTEDEVPFTALDAHRAELFAQHVASAFLLAELAEGRALLSNQVEKLEELNRLKDEFVANVSHELRTPLTAIIGNVMTVAGLGDMLGADERRELLIAAERQAKRLAELLENLLAESRLIGDEPAVVPVRVEIGPFLEEVGDTLRFRAPDRQIEIKASGRMEIVTDRTLLYRILFNLGDNALKYSDGPVRLVAKREEGGVRIDVVDHGVGIAPDDVPRIFEQFQQLDGSISRRVGGVGLGLHLCARGTVALGGRIEVESTQGKGSTFSVWLPRETPRRS
jgi:signal transduction histidine kinase